jgi:uncharacterized protein (TIGR00299 family) protein
MVVAYFDCFSGIAGDMILGALIDSGVKLSFLKKELQKLGLSGYNIYTKQVKYNNVTGTDVTIEIEETHAHRHLSDINRLIGQSRLDINIKKISKQIFYNLAKAESKVHNINIEDVHFHEVGAVDAIIDIVGSIIGIKKLKIKKIYCSPLPLGKGFVKCSHGILPIPAPATVELLKGFPVYSDERKQELVTPTGAAIITTIADKFGNMPLMKISKIGYGSGKIKSKYPNLLRFYIGELYKKNKNKKN